MNDSAWTVRCHVPVELEARLRVGSMSPEWIAALQTHDISGNDLSCDKARQGWLLAPRSWSGEVYENEIAASSASTYGPWRTFVMR